MVSKQEVSWPIVHIGGMGFWGLTAQEVCTCDTGCVVGCHIVLLKHDDWVHSIIPEDVLEKDLQGNDAQTLHRVIRLYPGFVILLLLVARVIPSFSCTYLHMHWQSHLAYIHITWLIWNDRNTKLRILNFFLKRWWPTLFFWIVPFKLFNIWSSTWTVFSLQWASPPPPFCFCFKNLFCQTHF